MATEIERKFLVQDDSWRSLADTGQEMRQGYLLNSPALSIRIRIAASEAWITIKGAARGVSRSEFEYPLPVADARELFQRFCDPSQVIAKRRHLVAWQGHTWEVDVFSGANQGLVVAELELNEENQEFPMPPWVGREVSHDPSYLNASLAKRPWRTWNGAGQGES